MSFKAVSPTEPHSDGLFPRLPVTVVETYRMEACVFLSERIKAFTKLIPCFTV